MMTSDLSAESGSVIMLLKPQTVARLKGRDDVCTVASDGYCW